VGDIVREEVKIRGFYNIKSIEIKKGKKDPPIPFFGQEYIEEKNFYLRILGKILRRDLKAARNL
jgi:hypothetical protein